MVRSLSTKQILVLILLVIIIIPLAYIFAPAGKVPTLVYKEVTVKVPIISYKEPTAESGITGYASQEIVQGTITLEVGSLLDINQVNANPNIINPTQQINFTANITSAYAINLVTLEFENTLYVMTNSSSDIWYYDALDTNISLGTYNFTIYAKDATNYTVSKTGNFTVTDEPLPITCLSQIGDAKIKIETNLRDYTVIPKQILPIENFTAEVYNKTCIDNLAGYDSDTWSKLKIKDLDFRRQYLKDIRDNCPLVTCCITGADGKCLANTTSPSTKDVVIFGLSDYELLNKDIKAFIIHKNPISIKDGITKKAKLFMKKFWSSVFGQVIYMPQSHNTLIGSEIDIISDDFMFSENYPEDLFYDIIFITNDTWDVNISATAPTEYTCTDCETDLNINSTEVNITLDLDLIDSTSLDSDILDEGINIEHGEINISATSYNSSNTTQNYIEYFPFYGIIASSIQVTEAIATPEEVNAGDAITFKAKIVKLGLFDVDTATLQIQGTKYTMTKSGNIWYYNTFNTNIGAGTYTFKVYANDTSGKDTFPKYGIFTITAEEVPAEEPTPGRTGLITPSEPAPPTEPEIPPEEEVPLEEEEVIPPEIPEVPLFGQAIQTLLDLRDLGTLRITLAIIIWIVTIALIWWLWLLWKRKKEKEKEKYAPKKEEPWPPDIIKLKSHSDEAKKHYSSDLFILYSHIKNFFRNKK